MAFVATYANVYHNIIFIINCNFVQILLEEPKQKEEHEHQIFNLVNVSSRANPLPKSNNPISLLENCVTENRESQRSDSNRAVAIL